MIKLSKRLQVVASFIPDNTSIIDVGCDHALLDIYLMQTKKNIEILATDINPNPLEIASLNIKKYHLETKIKLKLMDGIKDLDKNIKTIIMAGMGGILMTNILVSSKENLKNVQTIILTPNNDFPLVREKITKLGFKIEKETLIIDNKKTYLVLKFIKGKQRKINYFFGTLNNKTLETIYYYTNIINTNKKILKKIPNKYFLKKLKLAKENKKIKRFLNN